MPLTPLTGAAGMGSDSIITLIMRQKRAIISDDEASDQEPPAPEQVEEEKLATPKKAPAPSP